MRKLAANVAGYKNGRKIASDLVTTSFGDNFNFMSSSWEVLETKADPKRVQKQKELKRRRAFMAETECYNLFRKRTPFLPFNAIALDNLRNICRCKDSERCGTMHVRCRYL